jgi:predicted nucleic acid-binding protein
MLADIPEGTSVFIDANILAYHRMTVTALTPACTTFLKRVEQQELPGYTSTALLAEAVHKIMLAAAVQQHGLPEKGIVTRLKEKPELIKVLTPQNVVETVEKMNVVIVTVTSDHIKQAEKLFAQHGLLTNDSITLAIMQQLGITNIATNDDDFDSVDWVKVWKPV